MKLSRGKGERNIDCKHYDQCLSDAAQKDWKSFNCEGCSLFAKTPPVSMKIESARLCKICGERPTLQPSSPYCGHCLSEKSKAARKGKQTAPASQKTPPQKPQTPKPSPKPETIISIDFRGYPSVFKDIEKLAQEEVRSISEEIIYMAKHYVEKARAA